MISLRNRLVLTYSLYIFVFILTLSFVTNRFAYNLFSGFVKENIARQSQQITEFIAEQYSPRHGRFDLMAVEAIGMNYVHQGYIITVEDQRGSVVWAARSCNMQRCASTIESIERRMQQKSVSGEFQSTQYPMTYGDLGIGIVNIETYRPYFYSESEAAFMASLRRFLLGIGILFSLLSVIITALLAHTLSKPILTAANAAMQMAAGDLSARVSNQHRTRELHELSRSLNYLAKALENGERRQKQLTADVAHELRTPLTTLQGNIEAMIDGVMPITPERLASCHEETMRLGRLVEDLCKLSILEQQNLVLCRTEFDLQKLLFCVVEQFSPEAEENGVTITLHTQQSPIFADYDRLKQVFVNLLSNAVKYTDQGEIDVRVEAVGEQYTISVADTGIGIPQDEVEHIFERFYRSDKSRTRATGGAGIGLTIVSAIVAAHGGRVEVASESGRGSVFKVIIPK